MKTLLIMLVIVSFAFAGESEFGILAGMAKPTGDDIDNYVAASFFLGGQYIAHQKSYAIEGSARYIMLKADNDFEDDDFSGSLMSIAGGVRGYSNSLYSCGGLEMDFLSVEVDDIEYVDESEIGLYAGVGFVTPFGATNDLDLSLRYHLYDFETDNAFISFGGGVNF